MKLWFSLYDRKDYTGGEVPFFDTSAISFAKLFESNYAIIKEELEHYLESHNLQSYFNTSMVATKNSWKTISLRSWDIHLYENYKYFPKTLELINRVDGLVSASFNLLEPKASIKPHCGDTNGIYRCHLGLQIPGTIPDCGFRVKDEWRSWEEGKLLVFVDANNHEAINLTNENRFIFLFDVVRPEVIGKKNYICSTVLTSLFMQKRAEGLAVLYKAPMWSQKMAAVCLVPFAFIASRLRNFLYYYVKK